MTMGDDVPEGPRRGLCWGGGGTNHGEGRLFTTPQMILGGTIYSAMDGPG